MLTGSCLCSAPVILLLQARTRVSDPPPAQADWRLEHAQPGGPRVWASRLLGTRLPLPAFPVTRHRRRFPQIFGKRQTRMPGVLAATAQLA